ncbi:hypothetical protein GTQ48_01890 [Alteromonas genovensis]|uniref:Uncharacterized protein n=1 Tax=Alteromonas genovensis TaxID=471225 RepID=A0A6N9TED4_9ALTE|nr:hypothetical protein [Alteromonas genovensis]NDW14286.1 hypothetical protein [Alteromonas genovensis]
MNNAISSSRGLLPLFFAALLALFACVGLFTFPSYHILLLLAASAYVAALRYFNFTWLYVLLFATFAVNLAPWTGRYLVDELDIFVAITGAYFFIKYRNEYEVSRHLLLSVLLVVLCLLTSFDSSWFNIFQPLAVNFYVSPLNGFVIFKGFVWALVLVWAFNQQKRSDSTRALKHLLQASMFAAFASFTIVMWEKQVLGTLFSGADVYTKVNTFFNLSSAYRTTGIISGMHTGGESIDGLYLTLLPLVFGACFFFKHNAVRFIAIAAVVAVMYCVLMGFTRATYAASFISMAVCSTLYFFERWRSTSAPNVENIGKPVYSNMSFSLVVGNLLAYLLLVYSVYALHQYTGYYAELSAGLLYTITIALSQVRSINLVMKLIGMIIGYIGFFYINVDSFNNSQWVDVSTVSTSALYIATSLPLIAFTTLFVIKRRGIFELPRLVTETITLVLFGVLMAAAFSGARINIRAETSASDFNTRMEHWQGIVESGRWSAADIALGHGLGTMPTNYALSGKGELDRIGTFEINPQTAVLTVIPGSDLMLTQRTPIDSNGAYLFEMTYSTNEDVQVAVALCRRNMIIFEFWAHGCGNIIRRTLPSTGADESKTYLMGLTATKDTFFGLPGALTIKTTAGNVPITIESISLVNADGEQLLKNNSFDDGGDFWFFYYDFEHLVWHIKNLYLSFAYQFGVIGALLIGALIVSAAIAFNSKNQLLSLPAAIFSAFLAGQFAFGLFGDPLDSSRTNMWFFFLLFGALLPSHKSPPRQI